MVSMLASSAVDRGFDPRSGQTKDYKISVFKLNNNHSLTCSPFTDYNRSIGTTFYNRSIGRGDNHSIIDRGDNHSIIDRGDNSSVIDRGDNTSMYYFILPAISYIFLSC